MIHVEEKLKDILQSKFSLWQQEVTLKKLSY